MTFSSDKMQFRMLSIIKLSIQDFGIQWPGHASAPRFDALEQR
jgi:hypothetical protein